MGVNAASGEDAATNEAAVVQKFCPSPAERKHCEVLSSDTSINKGFFLMVGKVWRGKGQMDLINALGKR